MRTKRSTLVRPTIAALAAAALLLTGACSNDEDGDSNTNNQGEVVPSVNPSASAS